MFAINKNLSLSSPTYIECHKSFVRKSDLPSRLSFIFHHIWTSFLLPARAIGWREATSAPERVGAICEWGGSVALGQAERQEGGLEAAQVDRLVQVSKPTSQRAWSKQPQTLCGYVLVYCYRERFIVQSFFTEQRGSFLIKEPTLKMSSSPSEILYSKDPF